MARTSTAAKTKLTKRGRPANAPAITALKLKPAKLSPAMAAFFKASEDKLGFVPNVLKAFAFDMAKLEAFVAYRNDLMLADKKVGGILVQLSGEKAVAGIGINVNCTPNSNSRWYPAAKHPMAAPSVLMAYK